MKTKANLKDVDPATDQTCPITGLSLLQLPAWRVAVVGDAFDSALMLMGDRIVVNRPRGYAHFPDAVNSLLAIDDLVHDQVPRKAPYIQVEDCIDLEGLSFNARHHYISQMIARERVAALIICNFTMEFLISYGLARRHRSVRERVFLALDYAEAVKLAAKIDTALKEGRDITQITGRPLSAVEAIQKVSRMDMGMDASTDQLIRYIVAGTWWREGDKYKSPMPLDRSARDYHDPLLRTISLVREELEDLIYKSGRAISRLKRREGELEVKTTMLSDTNTTLKILLHRGDEERRNLEEKVLFNVKELIQPYLGKLRETELTKQQDAYLSIMENNLAEIISPLARKLAYEYSYFTPSEIQVANFVKNGMTTRQIAEVLNLSTRTVDTYRHTIRDKLGLKGIKVNLRTYLLSFE